MWLAALTAASARRPGRVLVCWLLAALALGFTAQAWGSGYDDTIDLPGSPADRGTVAIEEASDSSPAVTGTVVVHRPDGALEDLRQGLDAALAGLRELPTVTQVEDPLASPAPSASLSRDGATALVAVEFDVALPDLTADDLAAIRGAMAPAEADGLEVAYASTLGQRMERAEAHHRAEAVGVGVALVVLLVVFGSVLAGLLTLASAIVAVGVGLLALTASTSLITFASMSPSLATMIGLGTGIDYALFVTTRHRQLLMDGMAPREAAALAGRTAGHAVFVGALTVSVALLGLYLSGLTFVGNAGLAAVITVICSAAASLTLVPASLALAGRHLDRLRVRRPVAEPRLGTGGWARYARAVSRHPWPYLLGALALLFAATTPLLTLDTATLDDGAKPAPSTSRQAFDLIAEGFGPGRNAPLTLVFTTPEADTPALERALEEAHADLRTVPFAASVSPFAVLDDGHTWTSTVVPSDRPQSDRTENLVTNLEEHLPVALEGAGVEATATHVTGIPAYHRDLGDAVIGRLPLVMGAVLLAALVLLVVTFRSIVLAVKAVLLNLLSIGAAYGVLVAVFQWQWGSSLLGLDQPVPIESYAPLIMFVVVFGLSMDYEVFLLSRVREAWLLCGDTTTAVAEGLAATARVIGAAALIMVSVFCAFAFVDDVAVAMLAVGLAVSVIVDATLVRLVLVPAAMAAFGRANWWIPLWLDRILPLSSLDEAALQRRRQETLSRTGEFGR